MAYRVFASPDGTVWHAWDVRGDDRPLLPGSPARSQALREGWICFESEDEKRRLSPVPLRWADRSDQELWLYCRVAERVQGDVPTGERRQEIAEPVRRSPESG